MIKICLPSFRGLTQKTKMDLDILLLDKRFSWFENPPPVYKWTYIELAREACIQLVPRKNPILEDVTHYLFIDDDINGFDGDLLYEMQQADKGIIGALYPKKDNPRELCAGYFDKGLCVAYPNTESLLFKSRMNIVSWIGFGFILIKKEVFQGMPRPWFERPLIRWTNSSGEECLSTIGEDCSFCRKAERLGFPTYSINTILNHEE